MTIAFPLLFLSLILLSPTLLKKLIKSTSTAFKRSLPSSGEKIITALLASTAWLGSPHLLASDEISPAVAAGRWRDCGLAWAKEAGLRESQALDIIGKIESGAGPLVGDDLQLMTLIVSVIAVESNFNARVESLAGAIGLMQVTFIGAEEARNYCPALRPTLGESSLALKYILLDPEENVKYGTCLLQFYLQQAQGNVLMALTLYNGGYRQLTRLQKTGTVTTQTRNYVFRVHSKLRQCQLLEGNN